MLLDESSLVCAAAFNGAVALRRLAPCHYAPSANPWRRSRAAEAGKGRGDAREPTALGGHLWHYGLSLKQGSVEPSAQRQVRREVSRHLTLRRAKFGTNWHWQINRDTI
jgi:hypothetical protein